MKISVIIPIYNIEQYLDQCINSVLSQTYKDIEVVLVDDGSLDNCPKICDTFKERDSRVKVIHKINGGLSDARNVGLQAATGDYIVFLDGDDYYTDIHSIESWVLKINQFFPDILIFRSKKYFQLRDVYENLINFSIDETNIYENQGILSLMEKGLFKICAWDKVVSRDFLVDNNIDFVLKQHSEDMEWCIKLLFANPKICFDSNVCHAYRQQNSTSLTSNITDKAVNDVASVIMKYSINKTELTVVQFLSNHFLANIYVQWLNLSVMVSKEKIRDLLLQMPKYQYLLHYNAYPYVKRVSKFKFVGFNILRYLINVYYNMKKRIS